jgi:hypothetical protein
MSGQSNVRDPVEHATRIFETARSGGVVVKVIGGIGCWLHVHGHPAAGSVDSFARDYGDVDLVVPGSARRKVGPVLESLGYEPARSFNAVQGETRLMYHDGATGLKVDVFVGSFAMCHEIPLGAAAFRPEAHPSLRLAELLLTKLQVVKSNDKDLRDAAGLLAAHPVEAGGGDEAIGAGEVAELTAKDWGLWRTVTGSLDRLGEWAPTHVAPVAGTVREGIGRLRDAIDAQPKSMGWRMRARIGERKVWYEDPEEPEMEAERIH